jgi:multicomponent Na+:H+ antiporter subunit D
MMSEFNPGLIMILGGLLVPLVPGLARRGLMLGLPVAGLAYTISLDPGTLVTATFLGYSLEILRVDKLSLVWGYIFHIAAFLGALYAIHEDDRLQGTMAQIYMGSAVAAVFAGDLITLFVFWELTAISSVFLIWATGSERSYRSGMRYLVIQVGSGVLLLAGAILILNDTGSITFNHIGIETLGGKLIFIAFGIKCAFPFLHNWLQDSYPEATVTGTVILSAFTTKLAIYALARGYAGTEILIYIGAAMTAFPVFFAVIENNLRRVLAYSLNNQLGFMVVGIGLGSELALNGTASHAFAHILYKALLFMSMGAVLFRAGTINASALGGLYKSMPWTAGFCIIGAMSISAFPLFSGFVSKSMILAAAAEQHRWIVWGVLIMASAGVMEQERPVPDRNAIRDLGFRLVLPPAAAALGARLYHRVRSGGPGIASVGVVGGWLDHGHDQRLQQSRRHAGQNLPGRLHGRLGADPARGLFGVLFYRLSARHSWPWPTVTRTAGSSMPPPSRTPRMGLAPS